MKKYFDPQGNRIVFIEQEASPSYWDSQWDVTNFEEVVKNGLNNRLITKLLKNLSPQKKQKRSSREAVVMDSLFMPFMNLATMHTA